MVELDPFPASEKGRALTQSCVVPVGVIIQSVRRRNRMLCVLLIHSCFTLQSFGY